MTEFGLFFEGDDIDQMALYAIYAPIIQTEFAEFVQIWNGHKIRTQKNREHVVAGIPMDLYRTTNTHNWGIQFGEEENIKLEAMLNPLQHIDIDRLLTEETENWCSQQLLELGFYTEEGERMLPFDPQQPYISIYLQLRDRIKAHRETGALPVLAMAPIAHGGFEEYVSN